MEKLFGIPLDQLMVILLVIFIAGTAVVALMAMRNPVLFKMAVRNIPRRRAQTVLIIIGLMLATLLFSASFATGDTMTYSIRVQAVKQLGQVDLLVASEATDVTGRSATFNASRMQEVEAALAGDSTVGGIAPLLTETAPVVSPSNRLSEPNVSVLGFDEARMGAFDRLTAADGSTLSLSSLAPGRVYVSQDLASEIEVDQGESFLLFLGPEPTTLTVAGIYVSGANPGGAESIAMPLEALQQMTGRAGRISSVIISTTGGEIDGADAAAALSDKLETALEGSGLAVREVKQEALDTANELGSAFAGIFLLFGQFSVAAGIMLIFLIFVMLAAERKRELGIARAVGTQQGQVMRLFAFEGALYSLIAAAVGSALGIVVGWVMVRLLAAAIGQFDGPELDLVFYFNWKSLVISYTLGMAFTFFIVVLASWRASRQNVIRAIRDIPDPKVHRKSGRGLIIAIVILILGALFAMSGLGGKQAAPFMLGTSMLIIGVPMLLRRFFLGTRAAYTIAGLGVVGWWLLPASVTETFLPELSASIEMFFLSGLMVVIGAVWAVVYNADLIMAVVVAVFGRISGLPPVLKTAVSYPMQNRFRTGMTLAMFSLVIFTLIVMAFILHSQAGLLSDHRRIGGGFDIMINTGYTNPVQDLESALLGVPGVDRNDIEAVAGTATVAVKARQVGSEKEPEDMPFDGLDRGYSEHITYKISQKAAGYETDRDVWMALQNEPDTAVVSSFIVPARRNYDVNAGGPTFRLEGFFREDEVVPADIFVDVTNELTGNTRRLRVIGVIEQTAFLGSFGFASSMETVEGLIGQPVPRLRYFVRVRDGADAFAMSRAIESAFLENGAQTESLDEFLQTQVNANLMINNLLQGFMSLGLVVGIAALGVIAARSVVERRQQIGMLRAVGFQKSQVQLSFLLESSFIALLGIALGVALGASLSVQIVAEVSREFEGASYEVPWMNIAVVVVVAYLASLLTTFLPARQASMVYPAEALRFID
ncbi:MAG: ABC transporter permease [SAR202 cluster bacterium]|nr:ABC transporter permease [SAR202 cluster bacterium]